MRLRCWLEAIDAPVEQGGAFENSVNTCYDVVRESGSVLRTVEHVVQLRVGKFQVKKIAPSIELVDDLRLKREQVTTALEQANEEEEKRKAPR